MGLKLSVLTRYHEPHRRLGGGRRAGLGMEGHLAETACLAGYNDIPEELRTAVARETAERV